MDPVTQVLAPNGKPAVDGMSDVVIMEPEDSPAALDQERLEEQFDLTDPHNHSQDHIDEKPKLWAPSLQTGQFNEFENLGTDKSESDSPSGRSLSLTPPEFEPMIESLKDRHHQEAGEQALLGSQSFSGKRHTRSLTIPIRLRSHNRLSVLKEQSELGKADLLDEHIHEDLNRYGRLPPYESARSMHYTRSQSHPHLDRIHPYIPNPDPTQEEFFLRLKERIWDLARELEELHPLSQDLLRSPNHTRIDDLDSPIDDDEGLYMGLLERGDSTQFDTGENPGDPHADADASGPPSNPQGEVSNTESRPPMHETIQRRSEGRGRKWRKMQPAFGYQD